MILKTEANMSADQCAAICNNVPALKDLTGDFLQSILDTTKFSEEKIRKVLF